MAQGADYGWVRFNMYYHPTPSTNIMNHLIRHEFSHILGLGHDTCSPSVSIMSPSTACSPMHTTLQTVDINLIDAWYP